MLLPHATWFANPLSSDSIHGILHNGRVCVLADLLAHEAGLDRDHTLAVCAAAAVHDCRRLNDWSDRGHGRRAAVWFLHNQNAITAVTGQQLRPALAAHAAKAISLHDIPYGDFTPAQERAYQYAPHLTDVLKAADCLDRYRLPLIRWWPNPSYLRLTVPSWLFPLAFDLVVRSEQARLDGATHEEALTHANHVLA
ncbi:hypothetical protein OHA25_60575 (plasmid) [Nonomuraea sp. NBC_00507]|uniref:hypothetical protein n=1 Tax=Nonomuraea sp. NBC_00507 TaxID=2976002 RepID=UPI002E1707C1